MAAAPGTEMKRTLTMTGLTINAMALIAPGAFLWTTFQAQVVQQNGGATTAFDMVPGLLFVLVLAFLTAISYAELSSIYPEAGAGSSYYFAEAAFLQREEAIHYKFARLAKFVVGWVSHLYYWIYPGIMVAFTATLLVYILGLFGIALNQPLEIAAAVLFSGLVGLIAYRGISGSTMTAVVINAIQLTALVGFAVLAIVFRLTHPDAGYAHSSVASVVLPHNLTNVLFQGTIAILLLVGFESVTALGGEAINPKRDVRRAVLLSLAIQGAVAYLLEYVAANFLVNSSVTATDATGHTVSGYAAAAASSAPIGDMVRFIGDEMLGGTGFALVIILAATVLVALIGTTLACLNTGVRITYVMGRDREVPGILGMLHFRHATPHYGVIALAIVSAVLGGYAVLSADNLLQITLASNTGTFLVYGMTNAIVLIAFGGEHKRSVIKHVIVPVAGLIANIAMLVGVIFMSVSSGGSTQTDTLIALGIVGAWILVGAVWLVVNSASTRTSLLVKPQIVSPER
ncbi:MAG: APC family permease [Candidatus Limnocylindrales bacterium]|jgi:amino acid transporter